MATLTSTKIKNTYDALLKATDNDAIGSSAKQITDGLGNGTPLYISTTQIGIGVTPEATYDLHVYSNAKVGGNLTVTGDLTVEGTTTTIDTQTLTVEDPLIEVASNNTSTDAVDIGFYGKYAPSGTVLYAGLFRDTGDSKFKLFKSLQEAPTTTVNTSGTGYTRADLIIGNLEATQIDLGDDEKIRLGDSQDLEIYHSSSTNQSFIRINGELELRANTLQLKNYIGETYFRGSSNGAVRLYYDASEKFITTSTGISVTDTVSATTFSGQLDGTISSTTTATTQTQGDNSTKVATTAYVDSAIGGQDTLAEILANGNTTGGTDIAITAGDKITNFTSTGIDDNATSTALTINSSQDATFSGIVTANGFRTTSGSTDYSLLTRNSSNTAVYIQQAGTGNILDVRYGSQAAGQGTSAMSVSSSGNTTFTGNIDINGNNKHIRFVDTYGNWLIEAGDGANNFKIHSQSLAADYLTLEGGGQLNLGEYGSGSFTGTATYRLAVDSSGDVIEIPIGDGAVDGSGAAGQVAFWTDTDTIDGENNLYWDSTNDRLGIGKTPSTWKLDVDSSDVYAASFDTSNNVGIVINGNNTTAAQIIGYSNSASTYNELHLRTNSTTTDGLYIDSSGNVGIGVTPESWGTSGDTQVIRISTMTSLSEAFTGTQLASNFYFDGTNDKYILSDFASSLLQIDGEFRFRNALSGTAGANITWNERMRIDSSGKVKIGQDVGGSAFNGASVLQLSPYTSGQPVYIGLKSDTSNNCGILMGDSDDSYVGGFIYNNSNNYLVVNTNNAERMRIDSSGNFGFRVVAENSSGTWRNFQIGGANLVTRANNNNDLLLGTGFYFNTASQELYKNTEAVSRMFFNNDVMTFQNAASGTAGTAITWNERMRIDSAGRLGLGTSSPSGELMVRKDQAGSPTRIIVSNNGTVQSGTTARLSFYEGTSEKNYIERRRDGSGKLAFTTPADDNPIVWENASGEFMRFNNSRVGIGETSIDAKLHLTTGSSGLINQKFESAGSAAWRIGIPASQTYFAFDNANDNLSAPKMVIDSSGRLGLGTSSPLTAFEVIGTDPNNNVSRVVNIKDDRSYAANVGGGISFFGKYNSSNGYSTYGQIIGGKTNATDGDYSGYLSFKTRPNNALPTERMRIDSSGDLTMQGGRIYVKESDLGNNAVAITRDADEGYVQLFSSGTQTIEIRGNGNSYFNGGNVGIGTTSPNEKLHVAGNIHAYDTSADRALFASTAAGSTTIAIRSNGITHFNGGNVLMNCTSVPSGSGGGAAFETSGTLMRLKQSAPSTATTKVQLYYNSNGEVGSIHTSGSATAFNTSSDYRLKDDYKDFNGLDLVDNINVYDFEWKSDKTRSYGVKAHELQEVIPQAVNGEKDGEQMQQVDYSKLVPILLKSIQELQERIQILENN